MKLRKLERLLHEKKNDSVEKRPLGRSNRVERGLHNSSEKLPNGEREKLLNGEREKVPRQKRHPGQRQKHEILKLAEKQPSAPKCWPKRMSKLQGST